METLALANARGGRSLSGMHHSQPRPITGMDAISRLFAPLAHSRNEMAAVAYLDRSHRLIGMRHVTGGRHWLPLSIRDIAADSLAFDAHAAMLAHNHPSGDPKPSSWDLTFTRRLVRALEGLGVVLLDHIVLGADSQTSLRATGYL